jgi:hypothetical protein
MKVVALLAVLAAVMVFDAFGPRAKHDVQRAVRNAVHAWEAPLPPLVKVGINFALNEVGIPMLSSHCAAPSSGSDMGFSLVIRTSADGSVGSRGCPKPRTAPAVQTGVSTYALPVCEGAASWDLPGHQSAIAASVTQAGPKVRFQAAGPSIDAEAVSWTQS